MELWLLTGTLLSLYVAMGLTQLIRTNIQLPKCTQLLHNEYLNSSSVSNCGTLSIVHGHRQTMIVTTSYCELLYVEAEHIRRIYEVRESSRL